MPAPCKKKEMKEIAEGNKEVGIRGTRPWDENILIKKKKRQRWWLDIIEKKKKKQKQGRKDS